MPLQIIKGDIVSMATDAIVYAETPQPFSMFTFNPLMIHKTGKEILKTRESLNPIIIGQAKIAPVSLLDCNYIIYTSAPAWHGGGYHELEQLRACYEKSFALAVEYGCKSIALPIIASDKLGYQKSLSQKTALECIRNFLKTYNDITVFLVLAGKTGIMLPGNQYTEVNKFFDKHYVERKPQETYVPETDKADTSCSDPSTHDFIVYLRHQMEKKELSHDNLCFKANITSETLTNLLKNSGTFPAKNTITAISMALELSIDELKEFLSLAGYTMSHSSKFDLIVEYCISKGMYDIFDVNQVLFRFEQDLLG